SGFGMLKDGITWSAIGLLLIPIISAAMQFVTMKISMKGQSNSSAAATNKSMMLMMPLFSLWIGFTLPAALGVYWISQSVFSAIQEFFMGKFYNKKLEEEEEARYQARQADRQKRMEEGRKRQEEIRQQGAQKQSLKEKRKAAQEAKAQKAKKAATSTTEAGRVGDRPYARGRSYKADRYGESETK
ncbi:YidC/Oxa1 family membrane protein insertase, partial [Oscillibacter sp. CAG:155]